MIIAALKGGLGNQMFQYACGKAVAHRLQTNLKIDTSWFDSILSNNGTKRTLDIGAFNIEINEASKSELTQYIPVKPISNKLDHLVSRFKRFIYSHNLFSERFPLVYDENIADINDNTYLNGYWQSELYFNDISSELRRQFTPKNNLTQESLRFLQEINCAESPVSLHIRRGDYLKGSNPDIHGILPLSYYEKAIETMVSKVKNPVFFIFTDDIAWVREHFKINYQCQIRENQSENIPVHEDMWLMSKCKANILANSSYSWWGAWLNSNNDKIVVAPANWIVNMPDKADIIPKGWNTL